MSGNDLIDKTPQPGQDITPADWARSAGRRRPCPALTRLHHPPRRHPPTVTRLARVTGRWSVFGLLWGRQAADRELQDAAQQRLNQLL